MPYDLHPQLSTPPDDTIIWRYLSFVKLMDLLERRCLWFARVDTFEDPLEGTHTDAEMEYIRALPVPSFLGKDFTFERQYAQMTRMYRETMFVNCWRAAVAESMAMWDIYGKGGGVVAIKSTIGRLKEVSAAYPHKIFIGRVQYVDWSEVAWNTNALAMVMRKDRSYEHEQEVRALIWGLSMTEDHPESSVSYGISPDGKYLFRGPLGIEVTCDPEKLVSEIMIGPREQEKLLKVLEPILRRYELTIQVTASDRLKERYPAVRNSL